jgi:SAM-dependent methyltransferase
MTVALCPNCQKGKLAVFYELVDAPVHNVLLMRSRHEALTFPTGNVRLGLCDHCAFISNIDFDSTQMSYSEDYEESQAESNVFHEFHQELADELVARYGLQGKTVLEIGCGKGEFLEQLCRAGCGHGIGFDPAFIEGRIAEDITDRITVHRKNYSSDEADIQTDFICCKMTLEHIPDTREFIRKLHTNLIGKQSVPIFFMLPDTSRILTEGAFWDIYYEHCSYFTEASLRYLFIDSGFSVNRLERRYGNQYLSIEVEVNGNTRQSACLTEDCLQVAAHVQQFSDGVHQLRRLWQEFLQGLSSANQRVALWGGGSKAVAYINTMEINNEIDYVIDIHPRKQGCFLPGSGHAVEGPGKLRHAPVDVIILMNPVYWDEVREEMKRQGCSAKLLTVNQPPGLLPV